MVILNWRYRTGNFVGSQISMRLVYPQIRANLPDSSSVMFELEWTYIRYSHQLGWVWIKLTYCIYHNSTNATHREHGFKLSSSTWCSKKNVLFCRATV